MAVGAQDRPRGPRNPIAVQCPGNADEALAGRAGLEDPANDARLGRVDHPLDVVGVADVAVPVHRAPGDVAVTRLPHHRVLGALPALLAGHLVHERDRGGLKLLDRGAPLDFRVGEVAEDPDARLREPAQDHGHLVLLAPEPTLVHHDQHLETVGAVSGRSAGDTSPAASHRKWPR
jgi:hypothetical protein